MAGFVLGGSMFRSKYKCYGKSLIVFISQEDPLNPSTLYITHTTSFLWSSAIPPTGSKSALSPTRYNSSPTSFWNSSLASTNMPNYGISTCTRCLRNFCAVFTYKVLPGSSRSTLRCFMRSLCKGRIRRIWKWLEQGWKRIDRWIINYWGVLPGSSSI